MMTQNTLTSMTLALGALALSSGCIIVDDEFEYESRSERTTTTTTTTTTGGNGASGGSQGGSYGGNGGNGGYQDPLDDVPPFVPVMGSISSELIGQDYDWGSSWSFYDVHFTDFADTYACGLDMPQVSEGSVASLRINGFEVDDEFAACPIGVYDIMPDCTLREGEACLDMIWRDGRGFDAGTEFADFGWVEVSLQQGGYGEPHACHFTTSADAHPDLSFDATVFFESWDLSPRDRTGEAICSL